MKAFVLSAGIGSRLSPLTLHLPKPMIPILGKPVLHHIFSNLEKNGFKDVYVNLYYKPEIIQEYFKKTFLNIKLHYFPEKKLCGTAGSVKKAEKNFSETFVVLSGDALTDINLKRALSFHKRKRGIATIVLKKINRSFDYGITVLDKAKQVERFLEKPKIEKLFPNTINTGIYILEPEIFNFIPKNTFFDFAQDLFPILLKNKKKIFGYIMNEYWTDIGNIVEYKRGVFDALDKKVFIDIWQNHENNNMYINKILQIDKSVKIYSPCYIGKNVLLDKNVIIKPYSVISNNVHIRSNARIEKSIIFDNAIIGNGAIITDTIVGESALIPSSIKLFSSIVVRN